MTIGVRLDQLDAESWQRLDSALDELLDLPEDERPRRLDELAADDPVFRTQLEELLEADLLDDEMLDKSAADWAVQFAATPKPAPGSPVALEPRRGPRAAGDRIGNYRLTRALGGGMGKVWEAVSTLGPPKESLDGDHPPERVAIKFLAFEEESDPTARARLVREARLISTLEHPSLPKVLELREHGDILALVAPFYPSITLARRIADGPLSAEAARTLARELAGALEVAHGAGIVHRDVKPSNVLLLDEGGTKLIDFGVARLRDETALTQSDITLGTPSYMAPEQILGRDIDARTDVWALGAVVFEMLTGAQAFQGPYPLAVLDAVVQHEPPSLPVRFPRDLRRAVARALIRDPERRTPDMRTFVDELSGRRRFFGF
ncbi:MAG: serine/threonine-protein kinase [Acidobacteriota bacterium]